MGFDLCGPGGDIYVNIDSWSNVLHLSQLHGWEPAGTLAPKGWTDWDGEYTANAGQRVTKEDARNMANALERSLANIPDRDLLRHKSVCIGGEWYLPAPTPTTPFEWFSGRKRKEHLRELMAFLRAGGFVIH